MIKVYWGRDLSFANELIDEVPEKLIKQFEFTSLKGYNSCYAGIQYNTNVFVIRSPYTFVIKRQDGYTQIPDKDQKWFDKFIGIDESPIVQFNFNEYFISEKSLEMSQVPAYLHNNHFTRNTITPTGTMNINKWFRGTHPAFIMLEEEIHIKEGDPLYYIKFETTEPVKIIPFKVTEEIKDYAKTCWNVKHRKPLKNLAYLYSKFTGKFQKKLLTEIRKNLI